MNDTKTAAEGHNDNWLARFGKLEGVTERVSKKGPYITFKLQAKDFVQYGACFKEDVIEEMKKAVGKQVWMKGPIDTHMGKDADGKPVEMKSYKVVYFRVSEETGETGKEAEAMAA